MKKGIYSAACLLSIMLLSCTKDEVIVNSNNPQIPTTYEFENVTYSGQTIRQNQAVELITLIKTAHTGTQLDATVLSNQFNGSGFTTASLNNTGKNLASKTSSTYKTKIDAYIIELAETSQNPDSAYDGHAGKVTVAGKTILVNTKGFEYKELIEKSIMGAAFLDQGINSYLKNILLADNETVVAGEGTKMQHNWDEAYAYFCDNKNPLDTTKGALRFWGNYSKGINPVAKTTDRISIAFRTGRVAINAKDMAQVKIQRDIIVTEWTRLAACMAIKYINSTKANFSDLRARLHTMTELYGFLTAIQIAGGNTSEQLSKLETEGLYQISESELTEISNYLSLAYSLESIQTSL